MLNHPCILFASNFQSLSSYFIDRNHRCKSYPKCAHKKKYEWCFIYYAMWNLQQKKFLVKLWWNSIFSNPVFYWTLWPVIIEVLEQNLSVLPYFLALLLSMLASERVGELPCREGEEWSHLDMVCLYLICYILRPLEETIISYNSKFSSVQLLCHVRLFVTPWTAALPCPSPTLGACSNSCPSSRWRQTIISSSVVPFASCLQAFPASGSFQSDLHIRWPKYWSFSFSISPSNEYSVLISFRMGWLDLSAVQRTLKS